MSMGKNKTIKIYDFGDAIPNKGIAAFPGHRICLSPLTNKRLVGFFIPFSRWSLMPDHSGLQSSVTRIKQAIMSQSTTNLPFYCILSFLWSKIWMITTDIRNGMRGLTIPSQNSWCGVHASGNCVPGKNERKIKL